MSRAPPSIAVTLPARTIAEARGQIEFAKDAGADLLEVRFDRIPVDEFVRAGELFGAHLPLIATLRSRAEGGDGPDDPDERARRLSDLCEFPFRWVDLELARDFRAAEPIARTGTAGWIVSSHARRAMTEGEWKQAVRTQVPPGSVRKVVAPASVGQLFRDVIPALPPDESSLVALTVGGSGPLLRAWSRKLGFPMVFASLPESGRLTGVPPVEPSQIPVDRLRPFLYADANPPLFAVVGRPVAHSLSPALHTRWMRARNESGLYVPLEFESEQEFVESIPKLVEGGFRGLNVTHPFKEAALELADRVGPGAAACGVANTLSLDADGIEAENTDLVAMLRRLEELRTAGRWDGRRLGVIGAGGAARATLAAARSLGIPTVLWARRSEAAELLARDFGAEPRRSPDAPGPTLIVHATTIGRETSGPEATSPFRAWFRPGVHVLDWVYEPVDPSVGDAARQAGATYEDGTRLLVYQAAASYGIWWGEEPTEEQVAKEVSGAR